MSTTAESTDHQRTLTVCFRCRRPVVIRSNIFAINGVEGVCLHCTITSKPQQPGGAS